MRNLAEQIGAKAVQRDSGSRCPPLHRADRNAQIGRELGLPVRAVEQTANQGQCFWRCRVRGLRLTDRDHGLDDAGCSSQAPVGDWHATPSSWATKDSPRKAVNVIARHRGEPAGTAAPLPCSISATTRTAPAYSAGATPLTRASPSASTA